MAGLTMQRRSRFNEGDGDLLANRIVFVKPSVEEG